jgi:hypothetical protein
MTAVPYLTGNRLARRAKALADQDIVKTEEALCAGTLSAAPGAPQSPRRLRRFDEVAEAPPEPRCATQYLRWMRQ